MGGAERCLETAVEYAKERIPFGRPICSFQSIMHKCAGLLLHVEAAKSAARYAAACATVVAEEHAADELAIAASMAKSYCSEAFVLAAEENLQIHGGIGSTRECGSHLYPKRARSSAVLFGDPLLHRDRLVALVGI